MAKVNKIEIIINAEDKATKVLGGVGKALGGIGKIAAGAGIAVAGAAAGIGVALGALAVKAAPLEGIGMAFETMSERVGLSLDDLRVASAGTISDFELMRKANIALTGAGEQLGVEFGKNMPALLEAARAAARATGQDVDFLFESLVTGVKRGSPMLIDNTGLVVKLGEANEAMAASLGKTVQELTAEEKQIALLNATVKAGQRMVDEFGGGQLTAAEKMAQFRAVLQNTKDQIGLAMLPALQALMEPLGELAQKIGPQVVVFAQKLGQWLGEKLPIAVGWLSQALSDLLFVFEGFISGAPGDVPWEDILPSWLADMAYMISAGFEKLRDIILSIDWGAIAQTILSAVESIRSWFIENWPMIQAVFLTAWEVIKAVALTVADVFMNQVLPPLREAFANLTEALAKLGIDWGDVWEAIKTAITIVAVVIGAAILGIVGALTAIITTLAVVLEHVTSVLADIAATFMTGLEAVSNLIGGAMAIIKGIFTGDLELIAAGWAAWKEGLIGLITALFQGAVNIFNLMFGTIIVAVKTFITTFINFFKELASTLVGGSIVPDMMNAMLEAIQSGLISILAAIAGFVSDVVDAFSDLAGKLYDIGAQMMESLKEGILSKVQEIIAAIRQAIQDIIDAINAIPNLPFSGPLVPDMAFNLTGAAMLPAAAAAGAAYATARTTNNYFNMTVNAQGDVAREAVMGYETARALFA